MNLTYYDMNTYLIIYAVVFGALLTFSIILCASDKKGDPNLMFGFCLASALWPLIVVLVTPIAIFYWRENNKEQIIAAKERGLKRTEY